MNVFSVNNKMGTGLLCFWFVSSCLDLDHSHYALQTLDHLTHSGAHTRSCKLFYFNKTRCVATQW